MPVDGTTHKLFNAEPGSIDVKGLPLNLKQEK